MISMILCFYPCYAATLGTAVVLAKWFFRVKPVAGYLLWPYVAFLTFANALNYYHLKNNSVLSLCPGACTDFPATTAERFYSSQDVRCVQVA
jgi:hypothetical protein